MGSADLLLNQIAVSGHFSLKRKTAGEIVSSFWVEFEDKHGEESRSEGWHDASYSKEDVKRITRKLVQKMAGIKSMQFWKMHDSNEKCF